MRFWKCEFLDKLRIFAPVCKHETISWKVQFFAKYQNIFTSWWYISPAFSKCSGIPKEGRRNERQVFTPTWKRERNFQVIRPKRWFFMTRQHFGSLCRTPSKARPRIYAEMCKCDKSGWWMPSRFPSLTWRLDAASWLQAGVGKTANPFMGNHHHLLNLS